MATKADLPRARRVLERNGFSRREIDAYMREEDAAAARRLERVLGAGQARSPVPAPEQVSVLKKKLAARGVRVTSVTEGRPTKIEIEAAEHPVVVGEEHADWNHRLLPGRPLTAAVYKATNRSSGNAVFNVSGFLDSNVPAAKRLARPDLYFFVLLAPPSRVWALARGALRDIYAEIRDEGKDVGRFASPKQGYLRLTLPETKLGFDLDQCVYVEEPKKD